MSSCGRRRAGPGCTAATTPVRSLPAAQWNSVGRVVGDELDGPGDAGPALDEHVEVAVAQERRRRPSVATSSCSDHIAGMTGRWCHATRQRSSGNRPRRSTSPWVRRSITVRRPRARATSRSSPSRRFTPSARNTSPGRTRGPSAGAQAAQVPDVEDPLEGDAAVECRRDRGSRSRIDATGSLVTTPSTFRRWPAALRGR